MTCPELEDRLFDEDCRSALLGRGDVPPDVSDHLAQCPACALAWAQAAAESCLISRALLVAPPPGLADRLRRAFRAGVVGRSRGIGCLNETLGGAIAFGALGASLAASVPGLTEAAGFALGASVALATEAARRNALVWRAPAAAAQRALRRGLAQLIEGA